MNFNVRMPTRQYDALYQTARRERLTVQEFVRRELRRRVDPSSSSDSSRR